MKISFFIDITVTKAFNCEPLANANPQKPATGKPRHPTSKFHETSRHRQTITSNKSFLAQPITVRFCDSTS
jgi:hypothetical protein